MIRSEYCRYLGKKCDKTRKSDPEVSIGTCTVGFKGTPLIICPHRFLQRCQIFLDTIHLLESHKPGNELHVVPEIRLPGGSVDYFVVSIHRRTIRDYVGVEIQAVDTTGTVWPARQQFIRDYANIAAPVPPASKSKTYGVNWKMTAKTILVQLHHKIASLELLRKKMVLVMQDVVYDYLVREFHATSLKKAVGADSLHLHVYSMQQNESGEFIIELTDRQSTTATGIEQMLGLRRSAEIPEEELITQISEKITNRTRLEI